MIYSTWQYALNLFILINRDSLDKNKLELRSLEEELEQKKRIRSDAQEMKVKFRKSLDNFRQVCDANFFTACITQLVENPFPPLLEIILL